MVAYFIFICYNIIQPNKKIVKKLNKRTFCILRLKRKVRILRNSRRYVGSRRKRSSETNNELVPVVASNPDYDFMFLGLVS